MLARLPLFCFSRVRGTRGEGCSAASERACRLRGVWLRGRRPAPSWPPAPKGQKAGVCSGMRRRAAGKTVRVCLRRWHDFRGREEERLLALWMGVPL